MKIDLFGEPASIPASRKQSPRRHRFSSPLVATLLAATQLGTSFSSPGAPAVSQNLDVRKDAVVMAIEKVIPSVVNIATETIIQRHDWYEELLRNFYGWPGARPRQERSINLGSGVIIDEEGHVLTNFHVVSRANRVQVKLWDGREYEADRIVATPGSDVALLKIRAKEGEKFSAIQLAKDDDLLLGETVIALGNPFGLGGSVTKGILSSKNRRPSTGNEPLNVEDWLQTDAAINPGNSGGPLVNLRGELIGLNVAVHRDERGERGVGVSFSIPVKQVSASLARFFSPEVTHSLWFGATVKPGTHPLRVASVQVGSPAAKAGIAEHDQILNINGEATDGLVSYNRLLAGASNREARIQYLRGSQTGTATVRLVPFEDVIRQKIGLTLLEPSAQAAQRFGINPGEGLFIENVEAGSPAARAGLERGYLLTAVDGNTAQELRIVGEALSGKNKDDQVRLTVVIPRRLGSSYVEFRQGTVELKIR